jgi:biopolymer transport protein ExbB
MQEGDSMSSKMRIGLAVVLGSAVMTMGVLAQSSATGTATKAEVKTETPESAEVTPQKDANPVVQAFKEGGNTMWALLALSFVGLFSMLERTIQLRRVYIAPEGLGEEVDRLWRAKKFGEIKSVCEKSPSTLGRVLTFVSEHKDNPVSQLNEMASDMVRREFRKHQRRTYPMAVTGTLAPLLGLFGTVIGLYEAFQAVAVAGTMDDPSILSNSIAKALITTVYGLVIAIPALFIYHFFRNRTGDLLDLLDEEFSRLMNGWYLK